MDNVEKLNMLRNMTNGNESDTTLLSYLSIAKRKMMNRLYPFGSPTDADIPEEYESLQLEIAVVLMNKRGIEGEVTHNENGVSRTYGGADVNTLLAEITPNCAIPG